MKILNGSVSMILGIAAMYFMFFGPTSNENLIIGFILLLGSIIFILFMMLEEQKGEIERLRHILLRANNIL
jgi:ABC-type Fe3+-siderophore transport system permease subunit